MSWFNSIRRLLGLKQPDKGPPDIIDDKITQASSYKSIQAPTPLTGELTQFPGTKLSAPKQQIIIGLDFGTAFTKVIIGEVRMSYAVPFMSDRHENPYLLFSAIKVASNGECSFGHDVRSSGQILTNLKMKLLEGSPSKEDLANIVAFLALVFRHCRLWLMENQRLIYEGKYLDWYVNVGLPTDSYHDETLTAIYHKVVTAAWALSIVSDAVTIDRAHKILSCIECGGKPLDEDFVDLQDRLICMEAIGLFPEFVAQVTGYVRSPMRKDDLHLMMDVGAGTIDISVFNVVKSEEENQGGFYSEEEHRFPIFAKALKPLGTYYLMRHRVEKVQKEIAYKWNFGERIPSRNEFASALKISLEQVKEIDEKFCSTIGKTIGDLLKYSKEYRYPNSIRWQEGLPTFLCGGGGKVDVYKDLLQRIEQNRTHSRRVRLEKLPKPERLNAPYILEDGYDRLMVAYGLSFNALDIGRIIRDSEIEDVRAQEKGIDLCDRYIDKDMV